MRNPKRRDEGAAHWPLWMLAPAYVVAYTASDWATYFRPVAGLNITPWDPQQAFAIALLLYRPQAGGLVFLGLLVAELVVRGPSPHLGTTTVAIAALTATFIVMAAAIRRSTRDRFPLTTHAELLRFTAIVTGGSLASAVLYVFIHSSSRAPDSLPPDFVLRYWVGDAVGLIVSLPLLLMFMSPARRPGVVATLRHPLWWVSTVATCLALAVVFAQGEQDYFKFFYLLLPPVVWSAVRFGVNGAVLSTFAMQVGLLVAADIALQQDITLFELQALVGATAVTALLLGVAVDERARAESELRANLRFAAAGQMAGALAHELHQPMAALSNYADACQSLVMREGAPDAPPGPQLRDTLQRLQAQAQRASAITRRLRDFFTSGATVLQAISIEALAGEALEAVRAQAAQSHVAIESSFATGLPRLHVDAIQIQVVLRNLLANAVDSASRALPAHVEIRAVGAPGGIRVEVSDSGPGVAADRLPLLFEAQPSNKEGGLGVGLSICRAIVDAHGGRLWAEPGPVSRFCVFLPAGDELHGA